MEPSHDEPDDKTLTDYLVNLGVHAWHTQKTYLGHLMAVERLLTKRVVARCLPRRCSISIYGTAVQGLQVALEKRDELRAIIGERAERWLFELCHGPTVLRCGGSRPAAPRFRDRLTAKR